MFCTKCGKELSGEMMFCPKCGTAVVGELNSKIENEEEEKRGQEESKQEEVIQEEIKQEGDKQEEIIQEEVKQEEVKREEIIQDEIVQEEIKQEEVKQEERKQNERKVQNEQRGESNGKGVWVIKDYDKLRERGDEIRKREKNWNMVKKVLIVILALCTIKVTYVDIIAITEGSADFYSLILDYATLLLIVTLFLLCTWKYTKTCILRKMEDTLMICGGLLKIEDNKQLVQELNTMKCDMVKRAYLDERGNACIQGKYSKYTFEEEEGLIGLDSHNFNFRIALEIEVIMMCLLKHLDADAPVNAYELEKKNQRLVYRFPVYIVVLVISLILMLLPDAVPGLGEGNSKYITMVQDAGPRLYKGITYEEAFDDFFSDPEWEYFMSDDGYDVVEFSGNCTYYDEAATMRIQFLVSYDEGSIEIHALSINGEEQSQLMIGAFIMEIFESYEEG